MKVITYHLQLGTVVIFVCLFEVHYDLNGA